MQNAKPEEELGDTLGAEGWRVYVEMARAEYQQEEDRWRSAQDKAKTIFAVAALVASLMFGRLDWTASRTVGSWEWWLWLAMLCIGSSALIYALIITAKVFTPKWAFRIEPSDAALEKLPRLPKWQMQQYLGKAYASTVSKNACVIDQELKRVRLATRLIVASLIIALLQLAFVLAVPIGTPSQGAAAVPGRYLPEHSPGGPSARNRAGTEAAAGASRRPAHRAQTPSPSASMQGTER